MRPEQSIYLIAEARKIVAAYQQRHGGRPPPSLAALEDDIDGDLWNAYGWNIIYAIGEQHTLMSIGWREPWDD